MAVRDTGLRGEDGGWQLNACEPLRQKGREAKSPRWRIQMPLHMQQARGGHTCIGYCGRIHWGLEYKEDYIR